MVLKMVLRARGLLFSTAVLWCSYDAVASACAYAWARRCVRAGPRACARRAWCLSAARVCKPRRTAHMTIIISLNARARRCADAAVERRAAGVSCWSAVVVNCDGGCCWEGSSCSGGGGFGAGNLWQSRDTRRIRLVRIDTVSYWSPSTLCCCVRLTTIIRYPVPIRRRIDNTTGYRTQ